MVCRQGSAASKASKILGGTRFGETLPASRSSIGLGIPIASRVVESTPAVPIAQLLEVGEVRG